MVQKIVSGPHQKNKQTIEDRIWIIIYQDQQKTNLT
jgi:hypothetical protein